MQPPEFVTIPIDAARTVSGLYQSPRQPLACYVIAHGAGAGMTHSFMTAVANGFCSREVATLRFQFPFMENNSKRPDRPALAWAAVRAAVDKALRLTDAPLFAGGKSFGARMTSQAQAETPLPNVRGLVFLGFPLHPAGSPSVERARHLGNVKIPMLFLQGSRDALADTELLVPVVDDLRAELRLFPNADHSFHVPARSGTTDEQVLNELLDTAASWMIRPL